MKFVNYNFRLLAARGGFPAKNLEKFFLLENTPKP